MHTQVPCRTEVEIAARFRAVRGRSLELCAPLSPEDMMVQSCPEASPAKWHLAHTTWFFESFVLHEYLPGYRVFNVDFQWLFNSYYETFAKFPEKRLRSSFSRPGLEEVLRYRQHVDAGVERLLTLLSEESDPHQALERIVLGLNHEEQHQELLLTDILHALFTNPLRPTYRAEAQGTGAGLSSPQVQAPGNTGNGEDPSLLKLRKRAGQGHPPLAFHAYAGGMREAGHAGEGFCFDNELPRHRVWLEPYRLASRLVTCGEYAEFMADGGYRRPEFWLSAGWLAVQNLGWRSPLYWTSESGEWSLFTLRGSESLAARQDAPISHLSYYEADAYAHWAGHRLATEFEWEAAAEGLQPAGNLLDSGRLSPSAVPDPAPNQDAAQSISGPRQLFGDCWEWTASAYLGYPGFRPLPGSLGEYNGKFMSGQMVLRGGSCATPQAHIRSTYRNFFSPETRWQFSGIRLAGA